MRFAGCESNAGNNDRIVVICRTKESESYVNFIRLVSYNFLFAINAGYNSLK